MTETRSGPLASPSGHPDLDALADLGAGVLDPAESARLQAHLSGCAHCRTVLAGIAEVPHLLRDLPPVRMPAEVEARIFAALGAERDAHFGPPPTSPATSPATSPVRAAAPPVASLDQARARRRRLMRPFAVAAAGLVLVAGVAATAFALRNTTHQSNTGAAGASAPKGSDAGAPAQAATQLPAYDRETITRSPLLVQILNGKRGPLSTESDTGGAGRLRSCEVGVSGTVPGVGAVPAGVQHIVFEGRPAYLLVYATAGRRTLVVAADTCTAADPQVLFSRPV